MLSRLPPNADDMPDKSVAAPATATLPPKVIAAKAGVIENSAVVASSVTNLVAITAASTLNISVTGGSQIDLGTIKQRCDRFAEGLEVIRLLLSQPQSTFNGEYYQLRDAYCNPKPLQAHVPLCIGGSGEKRTLPLVAKYADHWNFGTAAKDPIAELRRKREVLEEHCAAIGRNPEEISISALLFGPSMTFEQIIELAHRYDQEGVSLGILPLPKPFSPADVERFAEALRPLQTP